MKWIRVYKGESKIDIDEGVFFGRGAFETILVGEKAIMLKEHINRLNNSLIKLSIDKRISFEEIEEIIKEDNLKNTVLKITVTPKNNIISLRDITYKKEDYEKGFSLGVADVIKDSKAFLTSIKSICYEDNLCIRNRGLKQGFDEMLIINNEGYISEGTLSNIFFVKSNEIFTPKASCGLLEGIMRKWVINNYNVIEEKFDIKDLYMAEEIFITNSVVGIMWINKFKDKKFNKGNVTKNISEKYKAFLKEHGGYIND